MILRQLYNDFALFLSDKYDKGEVAAIRNIIFDWMGINKQDVITYPLKEIDEPTATKVHQAALQLRSHKPIQYITGEAWFYKLKFQVSAAVLIPRPETEELIELVGIKTKDQDNIQILDIGTGSGCISITLKKLRPLTEVTAVDVSGHALTIAKSNAAFHNAPIHFIKLNFLEEKEWSDLGKYDVIISNPPYIPASEESQMENNVTKFEPHLALFVPDERPYIFYEKIAEFSADHLADTGKIFLEVHEDHAQQVADIFTSAGFAAEVHLDISGKERMVFATRSR